MPAKEKVLGSKFLCWFFLFLDCPLCFLFSVVGMVPRPNPECCRGLNLNKKKTPKQRPLQKKFGTPNKTYMQHVKNGGPSFPFWDATQVMWLSWMWYLKSFQVFSLMGLDMRPMRWRSCRECWRVEMGRGRYDMCLRFHPFHLFEDFELILSFLVLDDQTFWSNGKGPRIHPPTWIKRLESWPKQPGFYEREAGGTCCSETDGKLQLLIWVSHANDVYNI